MTSNTFNQSAVSTLKPTTTEKESSTSTQTVPSGVTSGFVGLAQIGCPSTNNTQIVYGDSVFQVQCAIHWPNGSPALNNNGTVRQVGSDTLATMPLEDCIAECVKYNDALAIIGTPVDVDANGSGCLGVTFKGNLTYAFLNDEGNCFLKDRIGVYDSAKNTTESAVLIGTNAVSRMEL